MRQGQTHGGGGFIGKHGRAINIVGNGVQHIGPVDAQKPEHMQGQDIEQAPLQTIVQGVERQADVMISQFVQGRTRAVQQRADGGKDQQGQNAGQKGAEGTRQGNVRRAAAQMQMELLEGKKEQKQPGGGQAHQQGHEQAGNAEPAQIVRRGRLREKTEQGRQVDQTGNDRVGPENPAGAVKLVHQMLADRKDQAQGHDRKGAAVEDLTEQGPARAENMGHEVPVGGQGKAVQQNRQRAQEHEGQHDDKRRTDGGQSGDARGLVGQAQSSVDQAVAEGGGGVL